MNKNYLIMRFPANIFHKDDKHSMDQLAATHFYRGTSEAFVKQEPSITDSIRGEHIIDYVLKDMAKGQSYTVNGFGRYIFSSVQVIRR